MAQAVDREDPTSRARRMAVIATSTVLGGMIAAVAVIGSESLERPLADAARAALLEAGYSSVVVRFDGREAFLSSPTATDGQLADAERLVESLEGVRWATVVEDAAPGQSGTSGVAQAPTLMVQTGPDAGVAITGTVATPGQATALEAAALAQWPDAHIDITVSDGIGTATWLGAGPELFAAIAGMQQAELTIADGAEVTGSSPDAQATTDALAAALGVLPLEVVIVSEPDAATVETLEATQILFEPDSTALTATALGQVAQIAAVLERYPSLQLSITGHIAIPTGTAATALAFSEARAQAVADELIRRGAHAERLAVVGAGAADAVGDNATIDGAALNRRVTVEIEEDD